MINKEQSETMGRYSAPDQQEKRTYVHSYLKTIGFSNLIRKKDIDQIIDEVVRQYDEKTVVESPDQCLYAELSKSYGCDVGISVFGEYDEDDLFHPEYYFPYFRGTGISTREDVVVEKHGGRESFAGACDDLRVGETLFFFLQNVGEYLKKKEKGVLFDRDYSVTLSGLASDGKILLPIRKTEQVIAECERISTERHHLLAAARKGDEEAMESLTMEDIDTYTMISKRLVKEDILTIVDTFFIPCGIECDQYQVLGEIVDVMETSNNLTGEVVVQLGLDCNDIHFDICINKKDLLGEPAIGRRFKGYIWLQGQLNF